MHIYNLIYFFHSSIRAKFFMTLAGFLLFAIPTFTLVFLNQSQKHLMIELKNQVTLINKGIHIVAMKSIKDDNYYFLQDLIKEISSKYEAIKTLIIFTKERSILATSNPKEFPLNTNLDFPDYQNIIKMANGTKQEVYIKDPGRDILKSLKVLYYPVYESHGARKNKNTEKRIFGYMYMAYSTLGIKESLKKIWIYPGILTIFFLFLGYIAAYRLSNNLTNRISVLTKKVKQIAAGNLDNSITPTSNDEFGQLVRNAETMRLSIRDLTENLEEKVKKRTLQLEETNKELEAFSYSVSHDIRGPLRSIRGFSDALLEDHAKSLAEKGKNYLMRISRAADRMSDLINDMLRLSRLSRGEMYIDEVNLSEICISICGDLERQYPDLKVKTTISYGVRGKGDPRFIRLALENLLSNAWKYSSKKENPHVDFGAIEVDNKTTYFVRDNGSGFDMSQAYRLFIPFQRLHTDSQFEGSGIGLATVQRIIHRHGGSIWAKSDPNMGAIFYFTLG